MPAEKTLRKHSWTRSVITRKKYRKRINRKLNLPPRKVAETTVPSAPPLYQKYFLAYLVAHWKATRTTGT